MVAFGDLSAAAGLKALNEHLASRSYVEGFVPSQLDVTHSQPSHVHLMPNMPTLLAGTDTSNPTHLMNTKVLLLSRLRKLPRLQQLKMTMTMTLTCSATILMKMKKQKKKRESRKSDWLHTMQRKQRKKPL